MAATDALKRAPKWAWYSAAGIVGGGAAIKLWKNRAKEPDTGDTTEEMTQGDYGGEYIGDAGSMPSPVATVTPSVVITQGGGENANPFDPTPYLDFIREGGQSVLTAYDSVYKPVSDTNQMIVGGLTGLLGSSMAGTNDRALAQIANAGSPPAPAIQNPTPQQIAAPVKAAPAAPAKAPFKTVYENRTRDNGKSGAARLVWCEKVEIHQYPDGRRVVVDGVKIKGGKC